MNKWVNRARAFENVSVRCFFDWQRWGLPLALSFGQGFLVVSLLCLVIMVDW